MKKIILCILFCTSTFLQAQFNQNFDSSTALPPGWTKINGGGLNSFITNISVLYTAHSLTNSIGISFNTDAHDDYLITPQIAVAAGVSDRLTYYVKNVDRNNVESYEVKVSTTTATAAAMTSVLRAVAPAPNNWTQVSLDLTPYVGQSIFIGLHAVSQDKFVLLFDDVVNDALPACSNPTAGVSVLNSPTQATLSWLSPASNFEVLVQNTSLPAPAANAPDGTGVNVLSTNTYVATLTQPANNSSFYVRSECIAGSGFSTWSGPYLVYNIQDFLLPYCGPIEFYNANGALEPITYVNFAGINKTYPNTRLPYINSPTPHKIFPDEATVVPGSTNVISVKGNTGGQVESRVVVYIDWNQNGVLNDAGETYFTSFNISEQLIIGAAIPPATTVLGSLGLPTDVASSNNIVVPLTALLGNTRMRIRKQFGTNRLDNPCFNIVFGEVHDYTVKVVPFLSSETFASNNFESFPNPVKDILNLSYDKNITLVSVINLLGQEVLSALVNSNEAKVDMSSLTAGAYMVKVSSNNQTKTIKIIKE